MNYVVRANIEAHVNYDIVCDYVYIFWLYVCNMWFDTIPVVMCALPVQSVVLYLKLCHLKDKCVASVGQICHNCI